MDEQLDPNLLTQLEYKERTVKILISDVEEEMIRIIDSSEMTDTEMMITVSRQVFDRIHTDDTLATFSLALQLVAVHMIDAKLDTNP